MKRILYTGTAPGQPRCVRIDGRTFERGETYRLPERVAADLIRRGGFEEYINETDAAPDDAAENGA